MSEDKHFFVGQVGELAGYPITLTIESVELKSVDGGQYIFFMNYRLTVDWPHDPIMDSRGADYLIRTLRVNSHPIEPTLRDALKDYVTQHKDEFIPGASINPEKLDFVEVLAMNPNGRGTELWVHEKREVAPIPQA